MSGETRTYAVNGGWTDWCHWSSCSVTCGDNGVITRARSCDNPPPSHGGLDCVGDCLENQTCSETPCSVDGGWENWSEWSTCTVTCGENGVTSRNRQCTNPPPQYAGKNCEGLTFENTNCTAVPCAINGGWSQWAEWSACSQSCGYGGATTRERICSSPVPLNGGEACNGVASETKYCFAGPCDNWTPWNDWSDCIEKCGVTPYNKRVRKCLFDPRPASYGHNIEEWCEGDAVQVRNCSRQFDYEEHLLPSEIQGCDGSIKTACVHNWIVVLSRESSSDFSKSWEEYKDGFGDVHDNNFYIGNEKLHCLTKNGNYHLRLEVKTKVGGAWYDGEYKKIVVDNEDLKFALHVEDYSGDSTLPHDMTDENDQPFSTYDRDNDNSVYSNCAKIGGGGYWYNACYKTNFMGDYKTHFEAKSLGADSHLEIGRILIQRDPDINEKTDNYN